MLKGVDISNLNGSVDMSIIKNAGNSFVVAKCTEGSAFVDKYYSKNIANAKALGMLAGAYHFARFKDVSGATTEANFFINNCKNAKPDFVVLDFEQTGISGDMTNACLAFLNSISSVRQPVIYCNPSYINDYLNSSITKYPLWIAHYGVSSPSTPLFGGYGIWQYSESGTLSGISGYLDLNYMTDSFYNIIIANQNKLITTVTNATLKAQIQALVYNLNLDYNAKLTHNDGNIYQELLDALKRVGGLIVKGHKSHVVLWIQQKLVKYGYLKKGAYTDMLYDEATFQAVTNMQKNWARSTDGVLKIETWDIFLNN
jgi:lysozyme